MLVRILRLPMHGRMCADDMRNSGGGGGGVGVGCRVCAVCRVWCVEGG